jgi:hypothetical protein
VGLTIVFAVLVGLVCIAGVAQWVRVASASTRVIGAPAGESARRFHGGVMGRHLLTSGSLVKLELFDWGVRLSGIRPARWVIPTWEARYDELAIAELVALPASRIAVWMRPRGEPNAIGFLTQDNQEILTLLQAKDVPVNRALNRVRRVDELYS